MTSLLQVRKLKKHYPIFGGVFKRRVASVKAVDGVSIDLEKGECFGFVGESGCGKTTLGKTVLRLLKPDSGSIFFDVPEMPLKRLISSARRILAPEGFEG